MPNFKELKNSSWFYFVHMLQFYLESKWSKMISGMTNG